MEYCPSCTIALPTRVEPTGRPAPSGLLLAAILLLIAACVLIPVLVLMVGQGGR